MTIESDYVARYDAVLKPLSENLESFLKEIFEGHVRIDRISTRPKSVDRFVAKANATVGDAPKYLEPLHQIQDQIGARIITFYKDDVVRVSEVVDKYFRSIESKDMLPERAWEFGYFGNHHVLMLPDDVIDPSWEKAHVPEFFELQIKTLFQHAWSEANHDLGYKPGGKTLDNDQQRQLAFTSAQAWGADKIFNDLFQKSETADEC